MSNLDFMDEMGDDENGTPPPPPGTGAHTRATPHAAPPVTGQHPGGPTRPPVVPPVGPVTGPPTGQHAGPPSGADTMAARTHPAGPGTGPHPTGPHQMGPNTASSRRIHDSGDAQTRAVYHSEQLPTGRTIHASRASQSADQATSTINTGYDNQPPHNPGPPSTSNSAYDDHYDDEPAPRNTKTKRGGRGRLLTFTAIIFVLVLGLGYFFGRPLISRVIGPEDYSGAGTGSVRITVDDGDTGSAVGRKLQEADVVKSSQAFVQAITKNGANVQPGTYELPQQISGQKALDLLLDPKSKQQWKIQVVEGRRVGEILQLASEVTGFPLEEFQEAAKDPSLQPAGLPEDVEEPLEGYLFPATYDFNLNATPLSILTTMRDRSKQELASLNVPEDKQHDILTRAAIIQSEGRLAEDLPKISRVIQNRLDIKMALGMDSTIHYMFKDRSDINTSEKQRKTPGPYNTYMNRGLPPGPISAAGSAAIKAAMEPAEGKMLYFVTINSATGETKFSETFAEHNKWIAEGRKINPNG